MTTHLPIAGQSPAPRVQDLRWYDWILISSSAGKDSQAMLDYVVKLCDAAEVPRSRIVVVHADLGRVEWQGTHELAEEQAKHYGLRFEVVSRIGTVVKPADAGKSYAAGETRGDLLDAIERRGMWPDDKNRYCTSDFKRGPIRTLLTKLTREWKAQIGGTSPGGGRCRILQCMGLRAAESPRRRKMSPFVVGAAPGKESSEGITTERVVDTWLPIHDWTEAQVWKQIKESGVRHHPAYDAGMPRLSCVFCIFAPSQALMIAGKANPELLSAYVAVEERIGHTFRNKFSLASIKQRLDAGEEPDTGSLSGDWNM